MNYFNLKMCSTSVNSPIIAKLADFGTAVQLIVPELRTRIVDQPLWLAPEVTLPWALPLIIYRS
jgi:hypothetical protein